MRLRQGTWHLLSGSLLGRSLGFVFNLLLSRSLGPSGLGLFGLVLSTTQTFELMARGGVDYGLSCALTGSQENQSPKERTLISVSALRLVQVTTLGLGVVLWGWVTLLQGLLPEALPIPRPAAAVAVVLIASLESLGGLPWDLFLLAGRTRLVGLRQGLFAPLKLLAAAAGAWMAGISGALTGYALMCAGQMLWLQKMCNAQLEDMHVTQPDWQQARRLVRSGAPLYVTNALSALVFLPLLAEVASSSGVADVGYLRVGQLIVQLFTLLPGALVPILFLKLRETTAGQEYNQSVETPLRLIWSLGLASLLVYLLIDQPLVSLFFGDSFLASLQPTRFLILAAILDSLNQILHTHLLARGRTGLFAFSQNISALLAAGIGWYLIPEMGLQGLLVSKFFFSALPVLIYLGDAWKRFSQPANLTILVTATLSVTPLCWWMELDPWLQLFLISMASGCVLISSWPIKGLLNQP